MSKVVEASKWSVWGILTTFIAGVLLSPILLVWVTLFMVYRLLTWPFRLVRGWLRLPTNSKVTKGS